jgi:chromosome segregation ATPase
MSRSRRSPDGKDHDHDDVDGTHCGASVDTRGGEIRAELEEEVSALRSELAEAEKQLREMTREREELLETLAVAQDAVAAPVAAPEAPTGQSSGAAAGMTSLQREKAMVTRERDRLKSRVGLLTGERDSLQRQLSGLQRKLARRCAAAERGQAEEQELLRLREENHSLRGQCLSLVALLGRPSIALAATTHMMMHRCWICSLAFESAPI